jgi:hemerythrin
MKSVPVGEKLVWADDFSIGDPTLDAQHQSILRMINCLTICEGSAVEPNVVSETLTQMMQYATEHFEDEERYMAEIGYPDLDAHRDCHAAFLLKAVNFSTAHGLKIARVPERLREFLMTWWSDHNLGEDMKIKEFVQQKQSRRRAK